MSDITEGSLLRIVTETIAMYRERRIGARGHLFSAYDGAVEILETVLTRYREEGGLSPEQCDAIDKVLGEEK